MRKIALDPIERAQRLPARLKSWLLAERHPSTGGTALPRIHKILAAAVIACCLFAFLISSPDAPKSVEPQMPLALPDDGAALVDVPGAGRSAPELSPLPETIATTTRPPPKSISYEIRPGDTLGAIFKAHGFSYATLNGVLAADAELLQLDVLRPGTTLRFKQEPDSNRLLAMSVLIDPGETIHYRRISDDHFEFDQVIKPSTWQDSILSVPVQGSFYLSARRAGLEDSDILRAQRIFEERIDFRRDLRAGDEFQVVLAREMVDTGPTGETRIEAIQLRLRQRVHSAFLHEDGNYYDADGESLNRAFLRYPMSGKYRVSSHYNLRRRHPVTGRIAPHHGVDFAMPTGTPVLAIGDGVVSRVGNHPFAGKYLVIDHPGQFKTRYLHLHRIDAKRGQRITRGERIALSGNTGRSTGPHLHYELHINDRPVDPLKADIPMASAVPEETMPAFRLKVAELQDLMDGQDAQLATRDPNKTTERAHAPARFGTAASSD